MVIKEPGYSRRTAWLLAAFKNHRLALLTVLALCYSCALFMLGAVVYETGFFGEVVKPVIKENYKIPFNYVRGLFAHSEQLTIDIKHTDYQKLAYKREMALREGVLHTSSDDFVPAEIQWRGKTYKVNMRLKGDLADHWSRDRKWSFRIRVKGDDTILDMKEFSLQHPRTRGILNDWCLHRLLDYLKDFIVLRYELVSVTLNGDNLGTYLLEEHFEKRLIEHNHYINAPIIRLRDYLLWYNIDPDVGFDRAHLNEHYSLSPVDAFNTGAVERDDTLRMNFDKAKTLLESFRRGTLATHEVFNTRKLALLFAVIDLFGYHHTTAYSNIRFYYNPVTSLLEPIGYDNTFIFRATSIEGQGKMVYDKAAQGSDTAFNYQKDSKWHSQFFADEIFFREYMQALKTISDKKFLDDFFSGIQDQYDSALHILYKTFPGYSFEDEKSILYANQKFIHALLNPEDGLQAYLKNVTGGTLTMQLGNVTRLPIEVIDASCGQYTLPLASKQCLMQAKTAFVPMDFQETAFTLPADITWTEEMRTRLKVHYRILGTERIITSDVFPRAYIDYDLLETDITRQKPNYADFEGIVVNEDSHEIVFKAGEWHISKNLVFPPGYKVICQPGTTLTLSDGAAILSYSPFSLLGSEDSPITIASDNTTGQGIVVLNADGESRLEHAVFLGLAPPSGPGWKLDGSVTFYESPVAIYHCAFIQCKRGDALAIIRSSFVIEQSLFTEAAQNALRVMFSKGTVSDTTFHASDNNALTIIGSAVDGTNVSLENIRLTGITLADATQVTLTNLRVAGAGAAIESRDMSAATIHGLSMADCTTGIKCLQTKSEYGPASVEINDLTADKVRDPYVVDAHSSVTVDGTRITQNQPHSAHSFAH